MYDLNSKVALVTDSAAGRHGIGRAAANAVAARIGLLLLAVFFAGLMVVACLGESAPASTISAGDAHTCGVRTDGSVDCWGNDRYGRTRAPGGEFRAVSAGGYHTCGLRANGIVECWGNDELGQLQVPG